MLMRERILMFAMALIGDRVRLRRQELGLTQQELAARAGGGQSSINRIENGETPDPRSSTLNALSVALKVPVAWLQGEEGADSPPGEEPSQVPQSLTLLDVSPATFGAIAGWADLERVAKRKAPDVEPWVWDELRASNPLFAAKMQLTVATVVQLARIVSEHVLPPSARKK
jgi:transcriptional regulator with XRE-family HTH domain